MARAARAGPRRDDAVLPLRRALRLPDARSESHPDRGRHGERRAAARSRSASDSSSKASCARARTSTARSSITRCTRCCAASSTRPSSERVLAGSAGAFAKLARYVRQTKLLGRAAGDWLLLGSSSLGVAARRHRASRRGRSSGDARAGSRRVQGRRRVSARSRTRSRRASRSRRGSSTRARASTARRRCAASISTSGRAREAARARTRATSAKASRSSAACCTSSRGRTASSSCTTSRRSRSQRTMQYDGEGWGLTHDGRQLIMSDGSATIRFRDPQTFAVTREIEVRDGGVPVAEVERARVHRRRDLGEHLVRRSHRAHLAGRRRGARVHRPRARCIRRARAAAKRCLNGIAYDAAAKRLFVTGKNWPQLYEIEVVLGA